MANTEREIEAWILAAGLGVCAAACGPSVVTLGALGAGGAEPTAGAAGLRSSGSGGAAGTVDRGPMGGGAGAGAGADSVATGGSSSTPSVADAGPASPPDAGDPMAQRSPGCGVQPPASDTSITQSGSTAGYIVDLATGYDRNRAYPLVFSFRGANTTASAFRRYLNLPSVVGADGIVVHVDCADGGATWDLYTDAAMFEALLAKLEANYCIDQRRVFVVGHETGAIFASVLACRLGGGVLRGLGSLNGVAPMETCKDETLAVWISQGNAASTRNLGRASRDYWVDSNRCDATKTMPVEPSPCLEYLGCEATHPVRYCEYDGGVEPPSFAAGGVWRFLFGL